jgi:hypothetical protein
LSPHSREKVVHHFTKHLRLTQCAATHAAQKHFKETKNESKDFIAMMRERITDRSKDDILNIDQTPITYSFHARKILAQTLDIHGISSFTETQFDSLAGPGLIIVTLFPIKPACLEDNTTAK